MIDSVASKPLSVADLYGVDTAELREITSLIKLGFFSPYIL